MCEQYTLSVQRTPQKVNTDEAVYSAIRRRKASTSSRMLGEKNLGNSVEDGVNDRGGMCCKAFLKETPNISCILFTPTQQSLNSSEWLSTVTSVPS